jgi:hypothetical protein
MELSKLSQDKQDMIPVLSTMFTDPNQELLRIQGGAGVGKTTVVEMIVRHFLKFNEIQCIVDPQTKLLTSDNVFLTATTNQALSVLDDLAGRKLEKDFGTITCRTIYSLLTLKVFNDYVTGETKVSRNHKQSCMKFPENSLIIIDEASYADGILWHHIKEQILSKNLNIILVADYYQASPVGCAVSPIFDKNIPVYTLYERFRYPVNSAIHLNSLAIERAIDTGVMDLLLFDETFEHINHKQLSGVIKHHCIDNDFNAKILAYKNDTVIGYNKWVCQQKYGDVGFHLGQEVYANQYYSLGDAQIYNNQKLTIKDIGTKFTLPSGLVVRNVMFKELGSVSLQIFDSYTQFNSFLKNAKKNKDWHTFYSLKESIIDIRHSWASTTHKAQGSTYDYSIVDFNDLKKITNPLLFYRLLNVAITRPRHKVFICEG